MNQRPDTIPPPARASHPRRPPAHRSVSLRQISPALVHGNRPHAGQPTVASSPTAASDKANPPSTRSPKFSLNQHSSGESSDAGKWFETTNNDARQSKVSCTENEPPFFLRNSSSADTPPDKSQHGHLHPGIPYRPVAVQLATDASSTDEFRSVIDDLTVANKKLRQKLKKYERLYDEHHQEEKLFEVRFHGLPSHKKKELEEMLRKFASELDDSAANPYSQILSHASALEQHRTASSVSRFAESGYASMSTSGQNSSARSNLTSNPKQDRQRMTKSQYNRQQQSIQSYLHDIPRGLLPMSKAPMTDKSKKKLIVRRLEQIFAGKRSAPGPHQQPMQQEEVAQSAATADRQEKEATGQAVRPEGLREAHIMPHEVDDRLVDDGEAVHDSNPSFNIAEYDFAAPGFSPDQRPTRPLDLDPARAQISVENMEYIRHLGFTPPDMSSGEAPINGHGWLYLNILINMAQLHIYNVTPGFVKDAIQDYSIHLEISRDGRKVRWTGGREITGNSGDNSPDNFNSTSPDITLSTYSPHKRSSASNTGTSSETPLRSVKRARAAARVKRQSEHDMFAYKPLFFHKDDSEDYEGFDGDSPDDSLQQQQAAGDSSGMGSTAMQSHSSKPKREDGPIIFYTKAKFCTDLSGDRFGVSAANPGSYKAITSVPLGDASERRPVSFPASAIAEPRGPMDVRPMDVRPTDTVSNAGSGKMSSLGEFGFSPASLEPGESSNSEHGPDLNDFEVSGLGGVYPDDNFSILVRRSQIAATPSGVEVRRRSLPCPKKILDVLVEPWSNEETKAAPCTNPRQIIKEELLSTIRKSLPSSALPPASYLPLDSTSSGDIDSDSDSSTSSEVGSDSGEVGATALQLLNIDTHTNANSAEGEDSDAEFEDDSDDSSVDLLATARRLDPSTVLASEREYDAAFAERLAEEIPAGSSAATAGGGSGFNTPEYQKGKAAANVAQLHKDGNMPVENILSVASSTSSRGKLKRTRTSETLGHGEKGKRKRPKGRKTEG